MSRALAGIALTLLVAAACGGAASAVAERPLRAATPEATEPPALHLFARPGVRLGRPAREAIVNTNGSPRVESAAAYEAFWREVAPLLVEWAGDPRLRLNPNFVAALLAKESGFEPLVTSAVPANGIAQITHIADLDLRQIAAGAPAWRWMLPEVQGWPRHPLVHREGAREAVTDSLVARGEIHGGNEYLFDPRLGARAGVFWLRILAEIWTGDEWPGMYGTFARERLNGGRALTEDQLLALVTVSYNQGHPYVRDLVRQFGPDWTRHLNAESSDYLERIRVYTDLFERSPPFR